MNLLANLLSKPQKLVSGHRSCRGCPMPVIVRHILRATNDPIIVANATGCLEVTTTIYPDTSWNIPWIHNTFENAPATLSGVERAYHALQKKRKIKQNIKFVVFAGDGGTYDIGLQSLSGMIERGHDILYVCYDNEAYMNTGVQRSSATPYGAMTTTTPVGSHSSGKEVRRKNITEVVAAHNIPYVAQASLSNWHDLYLKAKKAFETKGPKFINVFSPCVPGWKYNPKLTLELSRLAVESNFWPLYEIIDGKYVLNYKPNKKTPLKEYLKPQKRFAHLFEPKNKDVLEALNKHIKDEWDKLNRRVKC